MLSVVRGKSCHGIPKGLPITQNLTLQASVKGQRRRVLQTFVLSMGQPGVHLGGCQGMQASQHGGYTLVPHLVAP